MPKGDAAFGHWNLVIDWSLKLGHWDFARGMPLYSAPDVLELLRLSAEGHAPAKGGRGSAGNGSAVHRRAAADGDAAHFEDHQGRPRRDASGGAGEGGGQQLPPQRVVGARLFYA